MDPIRARYMRACIRANRPLDVHAWRDDELLDVFAAIPAPATNLEAFAAQFEDLAPPAVDESQLTEKELEANQWFIDAIAKWKTQHFEI